jgi:hypothetical protein
MKIPSSVLFTLFILTSFWGSAQVVGAYSGASYGRFYNINRGSNAHFSSEYVQQFGFRAGIEMKNIKIDSFFTLKFALGYENYGGYFKVRNGGLGGSTTDEGTVSKDVLTIQVYPFNIKVINHLTIRAGLEMNVLLNEEINGTRSGWQIQSSPIPTNPYFSTNLSDIDDYVKKVNYGFNFSLGYEFKIGNLVLEPQYNFFLGASKEFETFQTRIKSMRQSLGVSVGFGWK